jgi:hypothetical protein
MRIATRLCFLLVGFALLCIACTSQAQVIVVRFAPPALPVYEQPLLPAEGYIWTPGYWAWDNGFDDYYWVPGTWVLPPQSGLFWTPPYWGWGGNGYAFYPGYWAPQVGYYGGINYGYGYFGHGYEGGRWDNGRWYYNRAVNNINNENIHNVYVTNVNERNVNHVSYNGGQGGIDARPTAEEERVAHDRHIAAVQAQTQQEQAARGNQQLRASVNQGRPPVAATPKPGEFNERGVVPAKEAGAPYHPPAEAAAGGKPAAPNYPGHAKDVQPHTMPPPNSGNAKQDQKYQKQQQQLAAQQQKEHQQLAQQQEQDHQRQAQQQQREQQQQAKQQQQAQQQHAQQQQEQQRAAQQQANEERNRQMEQQHQQQTQQMEERHAQQQQQMQARQQPASHGAPPPAPHGGPPPEKH